MRNDNFIFKTQISFAICSDDSVVDPATITDTLRLKPSRFHKKGDQFVSKHSGSVGNKHRTVWAIDTEWTYREDETISHHIESLKEILLSKTDILQKFKEDERFEISFWIWIETNYIGIGLDFMEDELNFLHEVSNRVSFSVLLNSEITEQ